MVTTSSSSLLSADDDYDDYDKNLAPRKFVLVLSLKMFSNKNVGSPPSLKKKKNSVVDVRSYD